MPTPDETHAEPSTGHDDPLREAGAVFASELGRWLILASGLAVLLAVVLIPARDDADRAAWHRDRALEAEREVLADLEHDRATLEAIRAGDEHVMLALAGSELRLIPDHRAVVLNADGPGLFATPMIPVSAPDPVAPHRAPDSTLARISLHHTHRLWLLAGAMLAVLIGLLPPASGTARASA